MERAGARSLPSTTTEEWGRGVEEGIWHMAVKGGEENGAAGVRASVMWRGRGLD
jgi:hypothetical protein